MKKDVWFVFFCTQDDVVSQRHKFGSALLSYFPRSKKLPCYFNFPVSRARPEKLCVFYWLQFRYHVQVRLECTSKKKTVHQQRREK